MIVPNAQLAKFPRVQPRRTLEALVAAADTARQEADAAIEKLEAACDELERAVLSQAGVPAPPQFQDVEMLIGQTFVAVYGGEHRPNIDWRTVERAG